MNRIVPPASPIRDLPNSDWEHYPLYQGVRDALCSLSTHFRSSTKISGILATDLHTLNTVLGAAIEEQVVRTLNQIRTVWDPNQLYESYRFVRQAQTFPDVLLREASNSGKILLGVELKGWYLLAKEGVPSLRFQVAPTSCARQDLIVVVPWVLENILSGSPVIFDPLIESARYAAEYRNHHWKYIRQTNASREIKLATSVSPYPSKSDHILDRPESDRGGNFGRLARTGIMNEYIQTLDNIRLCGIEVNYWRSFFSIFRENTTAKDARIALDKLRNKVQERTTLGPLDRSESKPISRVADQAILTHSAQSVATIVEELEALFDHMDI